MPRPRRRHDGGADIIKSSRDYDDVHIVDEKLGNVNNVNMMLTISTKVTQPFHCTSR